MRLLDEMESDDGDEGSPDHRQRYGGGQAHDEAGGDDLLRPAAQALPLHQPRDVEDRSRSGAAAETRFLAGNEEWAFQGLHGRPCRHAGRAGLPHKFYRVAARRALGVSPPSAGFHHAEPRNVDPFFGNLVAVAKFGLTFEHFETRRPDGEPRIDLARCCDLHELLIVEAVNRDRAEKKAKRKRGKRGRGDS